jgi:hypothetical protein
MFSSSRSTLGSIGVVHPVDGKDNSISSSCSFCRSSIDEIQLQQEHIESMFGI